VRRQPGGLPEGATLARMTVCLLVPYRFASADTLAPPAIWHEGGARADCTRLARVGCDLVER
jgi:hypothetical protein